MNAVSRVVLPCLVALAAGGCTAAHNAATGASATAENAVESATGAVTDKSIDVAIRGELIDDPLVESKGVHVHTESGIVTLTGEQPSLAARDRAGAIAAGTEGVRGIVNDIRVVGPS
jgi:osmotically-inducible protein OsmY